MSKVQQLIFSKILSTVTLHSHFNKALTFENFVQKDEMMSKVQQLQQQYLALNQELIKLRAWAEEVKTEKERKEGSSTSTAGHTVRVQSSDGDGKGGDGIGGQGKGGQGKGGQGRSTALYLRSQAPTAASVFGCRV